MNTDSGVGQDNELADRDSGTVEQTKTYVRGVQGERIIKALSKVEEKKRKRMARQEQVYYFILSTCNCRRCIPQIVYPKF